jgi:NAD(P)H dehydrogenase (quinone)
MIKVLIIYSDRSGHTEAMAYSIAQGAKEANTEVTVKRVSDTNHKELLESDVIIMGSPTYYGLPSGELKQFLDESVQNHGELAGKIGGAFTSSANIGGGNETTVLAIIQAMFVHGMIIQGNVTGDHYGPVSIDAPDHRVRKQCVAYGNRLASLAKQLYETEGIEFVNSEKT